jgi:adenine deaminase
VTDAQPAEELDPLEQVRRATATRTATEGEWREAIQAAIRAGVRVADIAAAAGVSAARVYQIRDNTR